MSFDAGGRVGVRSAKQIKNNLFAQRRITKKDGGTIPLGLLEDRYDITEFDEDTESYNVSELAIYNTVKNSIAIDEKRDFPQKCLSIVSRLLFTRLPLIFIGH